LKPLIRLVFGGFAGLATGTSFPTHNPLVAGSIPAGPTEIVIARSDSDVAISNLKNGIAAQTTLAMIL